jgi:FtsK/SpoIIIE family
VAGLVRVWAADPKLMELAYGRAIFDRFGRYAADPAAIAAMLEDAVKQMQARAAIFAGKHREHTPSIEHPFIVVLVDEVAFLTAYLSDRAIRDRIKGALATLTTQGRAVGYSVVAALQDPRKEVMSIRNLFPDRIAMRLDEPEQVDMVLGDGARDRGALADQISTDETTGAGVAYVRLATDPDPVRVRAAWSPTPTSAPWPPSTPQPRRCARLGLMPHDRPHHLADRRPLPTLRRSSDRDLRAVQRPGDPAVPGLRLVGHLGGAAAGADGLSIGLSGRHGCRRDRLPPGRRHRLSAVPSRPGRRLPRAFARPCADRVLSPARR